LVYYFAKASPTRKYRKVMFGFSMGRIDSAVASVSHDSWNRLLNSIFICFFELNFSSQSPLNSKGVELLYRTMLLSFKIQLFTASILRRMFKMIEGGSPFTLY
jgi:hypothetical protein